ncbi:hypothetical protein LOK49_LG03G00029 [Camellia lanceoleosa]|uniref:Uncharacterized protein n=1 Tax=Camellia lanceoleosa TaxID=1840588 RepID=A0ACC0IAA2_9ERIC|nr:hypothetical protein LOK49_LG03G00029 [Camellia lanceoleosa]
MQATLYFAPSSIPRLIPSSNTTASPLSWRSIPQLQTTQQCPLVKLTATPNDTSTVDYSSMNSVFPAEACETVGGEACDAEMYPEVKLNPEAKNNKSRAAPETVDREYLEYNNPKTVFPGEACDDLGGEFCEPEYQSGVY